MACKGPGMHVVHSWKRWGGMLMVQVGYRKSSVLAYKIRGFFYPEKNNKRVLSLWPLGGSAVVLEYGSCFRYFSDGSVCDK